MTLCQHIIKGAAYLTTGPCKKYSSCRTNGGRGGAKKKKKKLREKLADCVASVTNAAEPGIAANLFLSGFFLSFFFFVSARRLSSSQALIKKPARVSRGAPDGSFKSFVCYCLMTRRFRRHIWVMKILTLPSAVDSSHCRAH